MIGFAVDFGAGAQPDPFDRYFVLIEALAALLGCKVDLVMAGADGSVTETGGADLETLLGTVSAARRRALA